MKNISMNPNPLVKHLQKLPDEFTKEDIVQFCIDNEIEFVNFHYCGWDSKIKTLNFVLHSQAHLEEIITAGERVDGSSLFPFIEAGKSDLYVMPRLKTAFLNPFSDVPTLDFLCEYRDRDGKPFESSPQYILHKASEAFKQTTGLQMETMGELEYYVIANKEDAFLVPDQKGYHASKPFCKFEDLRTEAMRLIAQCGGMIKYGHSEVGNFTDGDKNYEQNEIEFLPVAIEDAADQLVIAKWIMRQLAYEYGVDLTFAPKITSGKAGSGMHVHCKFSSIDGKKNDALNEAANLGVTNAFAKAIAGFMLAGTSLPAWGNPHPLSFQRLVPHQEAPTSLCWSFSNRSALVRVPLGWSFMPEYAYKQTFEWRASDAFADTYLLMAALCCAARHGFEQAKALKVAEKTYVGLGVNIHDAKNEELMNSLEQLPASCADAADELQKDRNIYTDKEVFSDALVNYQIQYLKDFAPITDMAKAVHDSLNNG
ncbi:MAG: glutamine synthetase [Prevotella sp.]|nr:glutamine synthetase [Candidatus Equicola stercoris]